MICSKFDSDAARLCASFLIEKKIVILPTDTVYGFSGIVGSTDEQIRRIKGREETKPFIQLIASPESLFDITDDSVPESLLKFWPGALTIIVHDKKNGDSTVALRCPGDEWLREVISRAGSPVYSTSVNRSGKPVLKKISEIKTEFENEVALIVDAGDSADAVPSTIVRIEDGRPVIVRQGALRISRLQHEKK